jgi:glycosyltransferase involved in cell wall biosynthesis
LSDQQKINVLIVPDLFPQDENDMKGIFIPDYLKASSGFCNVTALVMRLKGKKSGVQRERKYNAEIITCTISERNIAKWMKPFVYMKYLQKAIELGLNEKNIQVIHAHGSILSGAIAWRLSKRMKIPFVLTEHAGPFAAVKGWKLKWTKFIMEKAHAVLNVSNHAKKQILESGIKMRESFVTYNPVDTELFNLSEKRGKTFLFAGRLDSFKGACRTLRAFEQIHSEYPGWNFVIAGDGEDMSPIKSFLETHLGLKEKVILKGQLNRRELAAEMSKAAFFVFPSLHETFGLVIAEALSCGIPVIAPDRTAPPEFVHSDNGFLVDPSDEKKIREALEKMLNNYSSYDAQKMRQEMVERFGFNNFGRNLHAIYSATISKFKS